MIIRNLMRFLKGFAIILIGSLIFGVIIAITLLPIEILLYIGLPVGLVLLCWATGFAIEPDTENYEKYYGHKLQPPLD